MLSLIEMSITGAILITAIIVLRALAINRIPKKAFLILWGAALARLILPFRLSSPVSIYRAAGDVVRRSSPERATEHVFRPLLTAGGNAGDAIRQISPFLVLWFTGMLLLALAFLITHLKSRAAYLTALPVENGYIKGWMNSHRLRRPIQVRYSDQIGAPLTYGILWPVLLLPKSMNWKDEETMGYILAHELSHIRRFDALTKWILAAVLCIHWFNPLVWAMYILANRDLELSCDEAVLRQYGHNSRSSYALALVGMEEQRTCPAPLSSCFSRQALKERIIAIMNSRPLTFGSILAACALIAVTVALFATTAPSSGRTSPAYTTGTDQIALWETSEPLADSAVVPNDSELRENSLFEDDDFFKDDDFLEDDDFDKIDNEDYKERNQEEGAYVPLYTSEQYNRLIDALTIPDYKDMSIAEFNRRIYTALSDEKANDDSLFLIYEEVLSSLPEEDPNAEYLINTVQISLEEYNSRMNEVYSGERTDPEYFGSAVIVRNDDVFGKPVSISYGNAEYSFTYRILDRDNLTVSERDLFLQKIIKAAQENLELHWKENLTEEEYGAALQEAGKAASTPEIEFTGCEVNYLEID